MSVTAGRLRHNGHRLQVADITVLRAAGSTVQEKINNLHLHFIYGSHIAKLHHLKWLNSKNTMKQKAILVF